MLCLPVRHNAKTCEVVEYPHRGVEPSAKTSGKTAFSKIGDAPVGALGEKNDPPASHRTGLAAVLDAFPEAERTAVVDHPQSLAEMPPDKRAAIMTPART